MKKLPVIFLVALVAMPFVAAQEFLFYDIAGAYVVYWQWFDLAFWLILFTSLGQYVFVQRMQMHKGLAVALGLAGGLSMLMLEYYGGVRLLILTPYFALIATAVFWIFFWHLLRAAMGEDHKVWTGILSFLLSLMMLTAFLNAFRATGESLRFLDGLFTFLVTIQSLIWVLSWILIFGFVISMIIKYLPGAGGGGASQRDLDSMRKELKDMSNQLRSDVGDKLNDFGGKLSTFEGRLNDLTDRVEKLEAKLEKLDDDLKTIQGQCNQLGVDIQRLNTVTEDHNSWLQRMASYLKGTRKAVENAFDELLDQQINTRSEFDALRKQVDTTNKAITRNTQQIDAVKDSLSRVIKNFTEDKAKLATLEGQCKTVDEKMRNLEAVRGQITDIQDRANITNAELQKQEKNLVSAKTEVSGKLDELANIFKTRVSAVASDVQKAVAGLNAAATKAEEARISAKDAQDKAEGTRKNINALQEAMNEMDIFVDRAKDDAEAAALLIADLEKRVKDVETEAQITEGLREGAEATRETRMTITETIKGISMMISSLKKLKSDSDNVANRLLKKMETGKQAEAAYNKIKVLVYLAKKAMSKEKDKLQILIAEAQKQVPAAQQKTLADILMKETKILDLEKEIDFLLKSYMNDLDQRMVMIKGKPKAIETLQKELQELLFKIHQKLDTYMRQLGLRRDELLADLAVQRPL